MGQYPGCVVKIDLACQSGRWPEDGADPTDNFHSKPREFVFGVP